MPLPNERSREKLLSFYLEKRPGVDPLEQTGVLKKYARETEGFSSADIKNLASEAVMHAVKKTIKKKKKRTRGTSETTISVEDTEEGKTKLAAECSLKEHDLEVAFRTICIKIKKERSLLRSGSIPHVERLDKLD